MESKSTTIARHIHKKVEIMSLISQQAQSGQDVRSFCSSNRISTATFYRWIRKYGQSNSIIDQPGFAPLEVIPEPGLFASVGSIRIYQAVSASFLKELAS
jgi:hypothetical protein